MNSTLRELKIELTQRCPLACVHCSTNSHRKRVSELPPATVLRLLREAPDMGVEKVVFTGGEPLVYAELDEVISSASRVGITPVLYTSGIADDQLTPLSSERAKALTDIGLRRFIFSVYSDEPECHERITRYGTFAPTITAINSACRAGVPIELHFVVMRSNFRHFRGVVRLAAQLGASRVSALRFVPQGRGVHLDGREDLTSTELIEFSESVQACREEFRDLSIRTS